MPKDTRITQHEILSSGLYREVVQTERALRHRSEYDIGNPEERTLALLCYALERSADGTSGSAITLSGAYRVLADLRARCAG